MTLPAACDYLRPVATVFGLVTAIVLLGVGVDLSYHGHWSAVAVLVSFLVVLLLEALSVPEACFEARYRVSRPEASPFGWWLLSSLRDGRRGLLYLVLALLVFVTSQQRTALTVSSGTLLLICSLLQLLLAYVDWRRRREDRQHLLESRQFDEREDSSPEGEDTPATIVTQSEVERI